MQFGFLYSVGYVSSDTSLVCPSVWPTTCCSRERQLRLAKLILYLGSILCTGGQPAISNLAHAVRENWPEAFCLASVCSYFSLGQQGAQTVGRRDAGVATALAGWFSQKARSKPLLLGAWFPVGSTVKPEGKVKSQTADAVPWSKAKEEFKLIFNLSNYLSWK